MSSGPTALHYGRSTIDTACPLDCPDACSLSVSVEKGKVIKIDGSQRNPTTNGFICAKVRGFTGRVYGGDRLKYPLVRKGAKGGGSFTRVSWDEAMGRIVDAIERARDEHGGESVLPLCYGGSNGLLSQDTTDAELFRALGASRLARTVCAAPTGAAAAAMYGRMPGVAYEDYPHAGLIVVWGANPSVSGIHLVPFIRQAQRRGAKLIVVDPRATPLARLADLHVPVHPGTDLPAALSIHRFLFENGHADAAFLDANASGVSELRERAAEWTFDRAADACRVSPRDLEELARTYAESAPAVIRCGWGLERNRNGGHAVMAVLALPAVAGKFGVRGGGYTLSNSAAWGLSANAWIGVPEPSTRIVNMNQVGRALLEYQSPPIKVLFVYNANPVATLPDQNRLAKGLQRDDLFTVVFDQVMTDSARVADVVLPATTFLEHWDVAKGYGSYNLQIVKPAIEPVGESRSNFEVFSELASRLRLNTQDDVELEAQGLMRVMAAMPPALGEEVMADRIPTPPGGATPVQFVDVHPRTSDGRVHLFPADLPTAASGGLYSWQPDPATVAYPLALISPASDKTISSTLGELRVRPASLYMHPDDATERSIADGDAVRIFNDLGEVHCSVTIGDAIAPGTVSLPKGLWRGTRSMKPRQTRSRPTRLRIWVAAPVSTTPGCRSPRPISASLQGQNLSLWVDSSTGRRAN